MREENHSCIETFGLKPRAVASGQYFNNDSGQFTSPHPDALNPQKSEKIVGVIEAVLAEIT